MHLTMILAALGLALVAKIGLQRLRELERTLFTRYCYFCSATDNDGLAVAVWDRRDK